MGVAPPQALPLQHGHVLCPCLVVPEGMELIFAVREMLNRARQHTSFGVVDLEGAPLCHVIVNEVGPQCGIQMQLLEKTPLAWIRTGPLHDQPRGLPDIRSPTGQVFCTVEPCEPAGSARGNIRGYELYDTVGRPIYSLRGDFQEKAMNVLDQQGRLVCTTERCVLSFDTSPHYKVRVGPCVDAGLVLCALLALDKLETPAASAGRSEESAAAFGKGRRPNTMC